MDSPKRFDMWCRRKDDSWSDFELIMEFPDGSRRIYTYSVTGPTKELILHEEPIDQDEQLDSDTKKIGQMRKKDVDEAIAILTHFEYADNAASPTHWLQDVIDELCARMLIGSEARLLFQGIREAY